MVENIKIKILLYEKDYKALKLHSHFLYQIIRLHFTLLLELLQKVNLDLNLFIYLKTKYQILLLLVKLLRDYLKMEHNLFFPKEIKVLNTLNHQFLQQLNFYLYNQHCFS
jgi:hypothetical protein